MTGKEFDLEKIVSRMNIDCQPGREHKQRLKQQVLKEFSSPGSQSVISDSFDLELPNPLAGRLVKYILAALLLLSAIIAFIIMQNIRDDASESGSSIIYPAAMERQQEVAAVSNFCILA